MLRKSLNEGDGIMNLELRFRVSVKSSVLTVYCIVSGCTSVTNRCVYRADKLSSLFRKNIYDPCVIDISDIKLIKSETLFHASFLIFSLGRPDG